MINDNLLWTTDEYEAVVDYKANSYNKIDTGTGFVSIGFQHIEKNQ